MKPTDVRSAYRLERIRKLLIAGDQSLAEISVGIFIRYESTRPYIDYLVEHEEAHIVGWVQPSGRGPYMPVLRNGKGRSKPRPEWMLNIEKRRRARKRLKKDPEKYEAHLAAERVRTRIQRLRGKPQPWFAALQLPTRKEAA